MGLLEAVSDTVAPQGAGTFAILFWNGVEGANILLSLLSLGVHSCLTNRSIRSPFLPKNVLQKDTLSFHIPLYNSPVQRLATHSNQIMQLYFIHACKDDDFTLLNNFLILLP